MIEWMYRRYRSGMLFRSRCSGLHSGYWRLCLSLLFVILQKEDIAEHKQQYQKERSYGKADAPALRTHFRR